MNIKKIIAGVAASALAVSAMAVAASAAGPITTSIGYAADDGNGNFQVFLSGDAVGGDLYNLDPSQIASYDVTFSFEAGEEDWVGGACIIQYESGGWWTQIGDYGTDDGRTWGNLKSGDTFNVVLPDAIPADEQSVILTFQNYSDGIAVNIDKIVLKDASGNAILTLPAEAAAPAATEATTAAAGDTSAAAATTDKNNADTGVEGVAAIAGIAIVAAGAVVVAKKRK